MGVYAFVSAILIINLIVFKGPHSEREIMKQKSLLLKSLFFGSFRGRDLTRVFIVCWDNLFSLA